jgi:uncharacterized protein
MSEPKSLTLVLLDGGFAVVQCQPGMALVPPDTATLWSLARTANELSLVCTKASVPPGALKVESGWRCFRFEGPFEFTLTGVLARVAGPLAQAGISIFALSTFDTDYVLVKEAALENAITSLRAANHQVLRVECDTKPKTLS